MSVKVTYGGMNDVLTSQEFRLAQKFVPEPCRKKMSRTILVPFNAWTFVLKIEFPAVIFYSLTELRFFLNLKEKFEHECARMHRFPTVFVVDTVDFT